ncbi:hypothetical protein IAT38_005643 [Cryptococcus sp. DSM 104549]
MRYFASALLALGACSSVLAHNEEWHTFDRPIKSVAVIGAGPAGLQATVALQRHNFTKVRLFEKQEGPGGVWYYRDDTPLREPYPDKPMEKASFDPDIRPPGTVVFYEEGDDGLSLDERWREAVRPSPAWESLKTNTPKQLTGLTDVPWPKDATWQVSVHDIQRHIRTYASHHGLNTADEAWDDTTSRITSYSTRVESLQKIGDQWRLQLRKVEWLEDSRQIKTTWWEEFFDAVVVASGGYDAPHVPEIEGLKAWSEVKDEEGEFKVRHSQSYRRPESLTNKTVLLLGASVSAMGISNDVGPHVAKLYVSVRPGNRTTFFRRRSFRRIYPGAEIVGEVDSFEHLDSETSIKDGRVVLANGTVLTGIDEVILATGFRHANSYLGPLVNGTIHGNDDPEVKVKPVLTEGKQGQYRNVDWRGFYIDDPTLAFTTVRPWTLGRYQGLAFAKVWEGSARIPTIKQQWKDYRGHGKSFFSRSFGGVQSEAAFRKFTAWLNSESLIHGGQLIENYPEHWREEFVYYASSAVGYWEDGLFSKDNFTYADNLPEKEWSDEPPAEIFWHTFVDNEEEY